LYFFDYHHLDYKLLVRSPKFKGALTWVNKGHFSNLGEQDIEIATIYSKWFSGKNLGSASKIMFGIMVTTVF
jgi:hypothetical protein